MNRVVTFLGLLLLVLAGVFLVAHVAEAAVLPLLILGAIVAIVGLLTGR